MAYNSTGYKKSKKVGDLGEQLLIDELQSYGYEAKKNPSLSERYDFDVICSNKYKQIKTFEIKYDIMASKTGNIAIEIHNTKLDSPSGIYATKADFWVHILDSDTGPEIFLCKTDILKKFIEKETPLKLVEFGGNFNARLMIYPKDSIIDVIFKRINKKEIF